MNRNPLPLIRCWMRLFKRLPDLYTKREKNRIINGLYSNYIAKNQLEHE